MTIQEAINFIRPAVTPTEGIWADIGAGTGLFTQALMSILTAGKVIAVDKSPHSLYANRELAGYNKSDLQVEILEADFNQSIVLPPVEGILMANSLHYADDHLAVLNNVLSTLKPGGTFILIEYDTEKSNPPWVPNPVSLKRFIELCPHVGLNYPLEIGRRKSIYQDGDIFIVVTHKRLPLNKLT